MQLGSVKRNIVHPNLVKERENIDFDKEELITYIERGAERREWVNKVKEGIEKYPDL